MSNTIPTRSGPPPATLTSSPVLTGSIETAYWAENGISFLRALCFADQLARHRGCEHQYDPSQDSIEDRRRARLVTFGLVSQPLPSPPSDSTGERDRRRGRSGDGPGEDGPDATVTASAQLPELDARALAALGEVGRDWAGCMPARAVWERALPVDRHLEFADPQSSRAGR